MEVQMKAILGSMVIGLISFAALAAEPDASLVTMESSLTISAIYTGDYNATNGRAYVACTNGKLYWFNLGPSFANAMQANALTALSLGKKISVLRLNAYGPSTNEYQCYRLVILN
jgi:hypothetical protein